MKIFILRQAKVWREHYDVGAVDWFPQLFARRGCRDVIFEVDQVGKVLM